MDMRTRKQIRSFTNVLHTHIHTHTHTYTYTNTDTDKDTDTDPRTGNTGAPIVLTGGLLLLSPTGRRGVFSAARVRQEVAKLTCVRSVLAGQF